MNYILSLRSLAGPAHAFLCVSLCFFVQLCMSFLIPQSNPARRSCLACSLQKPLRSFWKPCGTYGAFAERWTRAPEDGLAATWHAVDVDMLPTLVLPSLLKCGISCRSSCSQRRSTHCSRGRLEPRRAFRQGSGRTTRRQAAAGTLVRGTDVD